MRSAYILNFGANLPVARNVLALKVASSFCWSPARIFSASAVTFVLNGAFDHLIAIQSSGNALRNLFAVDCDVTRQNTVVSRESQSTGAAPTLY